MRPALLLLLLAAAAHAVQHGLRTGHRTTTKASDAVLGKSRKFPFNFLPVSYTYGQRINALKHPPQMGAISIKKEIATTSTTTESTTTTTTTTTTKAAPTTTPDPTTTEIILAPTKTIPPTTQEIKTTIFEGSTENVVESTTPLPTTTPEPTTTLVPDFDDASTPFALHQGQSQRLFWSPDEGRFCEEEKDAQLSSPGQPLFWPRTRVRETALPSRPCLSSDFAFVTRLCQLGNDSRATWARPNGTCAHKGTSAATIELFSANNEGVTSVNVASITRRIASALGAAAVPSPADVLMVDKLFGQIERHSSSLGHKSLVHVGSVIDSVVASCAQHQLDFEKPTLKAATNAILWKVDGILEKIQVDEHGLAVANTRSASLMAVDVAKSGVTGAHVQGQQISPLRGSSQGSPEASAQLLLPGSKQRASFVLLDERLFRSEGQQLAGRVLGASVQGQQTWTQHSSPVVRLKFRRRPEQHPRVACAYWDLFESRWRTEGCTLVGREGDLDVCECTHLTHFGEIVGGVGGSKALDIISIVGCSLSLLGLLGIAATAVFFHHWRSRLGNKILLNLSASIGLTMVAFLAVALDGGRHSQAGCVTLGVLLHFSVLASFCWMLVSAALQFLRFVVVLSSRPPHFLLKGVLVGWCAPLLPVLVLLVIGPTRTYPESAPDSGFCYPSGFGLYFGVVMPVACAVLANLIVFCIIVYRVSCGRPKNLTISSVTERHTMALRQLRMSVLLFFLLGLTWVFGLLALVAPLATVFSYLFCGTATLQGLALFLFFVVWEKKTRALWLARLPERFAPARTSRPTTTSTAFSSESQSAPQRSEAAPLRQRGSEIEMRRNFGATHPHPSSTGSRTTQVTSCASAD